MWTVWQISVARLLYNYSGRFQKFVEHMIYKNKIFCQGVYFLPIALIFCFERLAKKSTSFGIIYRALTSIISPFPGFFILPSVVFLLATFCHSINCSCYFSKIHSCSMLTRTEKNIYYLLILASHVAHSIHGHR